MPKDAEAFARAALKQAGVDAIEENDQREATLWSGNYGFASDSASDRSDIGDGDSDQVSPERHIEAMDKINALVNVRERTRKEICDRLRRAGFSEAEVQDAVASAVRVGLISEERYAFAFVRGKAHLGWGRNKIAQRLHQDGIPDEIIDACMEEFSDDDDELERALRELAKRPCRAADPYSSLMRRLVSKGYSYEVAQRAVRQHLALS